MYFFVNQVTNFMFTKFPQIKHDTAETLSKLTLKYNMDRANFIRKLREKICC